MQRRQFLTTSALTLAGILSGNTPAKAIDDGYTDVKEGTCRNPIFNSNSDYTIRVAYKTDVPPVLVILESDRNFSADAYLETVDREQVLKRIEENKRIFKVAETAASLLGFSNPLGISLDSLLQRTSPELAQELEDVERWDIYRHITGSIAGNRVVPISDYVSFRPSNIPEVKDMTVTTQGDKATIRWEGYDRTTYPDLNLPWHKLKIPELPLNNIDLTTYLEEPYDSTVPFFDVQLLQGNTKIRHEPRFTHQGANFPDLKLGIDYRIRVQPTDHAMNTGESVYSSSFRIGNDQTTQKKVKSPEEVVKEWYQVWSAVGDDNITQQDIQRFITFNSKHSQILSKEDLIYSEVKFWLENRRRSYHYRNYGIDSIKSGVLETRITTHTEKSPDGGYSYDPRENGVFTLKKQNNVWVITDIN
tara:strand:- start:638 stop:1891 length:1254 start_codon:yes stop_codon:yes gene_type:complete